MKSGEKTFNKSVFCFLKYSFAASFLLLYFTLSFQAQTYKNPVIPGDFPDPSIIRVGGDYYATATTGGWSPHFPLLHSRDLVNWKIVGAVLAVKPKWAKGDFWAPEIVEDKGRFFVYYTARRDEGKNKKGTLCVAVAVAAKPEGPYTDKGALICQKMGSIDADFARDENDRPYLIWKEDGNDRRQPTWIYAQKLDETGTKLTGKPTRLFRNTAAWEGNVVEGSFILRRDGWFYMFYSGNACCGNDCNYALGVARSKTLLGKWEKNPANPILAENEDWRCPGHGSIVKTPDGRDFLLYHAYGKNRSFNIGRQALLDEVVFKNGWATINDGRGASKNSITPFKNTKQQSVFSNLSDEFSGKFLSPRWSQSLNQSGTERIGNGFLTFAPARKEFSAEKMPEIVVAQRAVSVNYTATTRIDYANLKSNEFAGISVYSWRGNALGISLGEGEIFIWRRQNGTQKEISFVPLPFGKKRIQLKLTAANATFNFAYSANGKDWKTFENSIDGSYIEGARIALIYSGKTTVAGAKFDWFHVGQE